MLIAKGFKVSFVLTNGKTVRPPAGYALWHDEDGSDWPYCSGLVAPLKRVTQNIVRNSAAEAYFGHEAHAVIVVIPSGREKQLSAWRKAGEVKEVLYSRRRINRKPMRAAGDYYHPIKQPRKGILGALERILLPSGATLYKHGRLYRLELARGCVWNWRGIVRP